MPDHLKKLIIISIFVFTYFIPASTAQNIVPNADFEQVIPFCGLYLPTTFNMNTDYWRSPTSGSPDMLHTSLGSGCPNAAVGSINGSAWGSEMPRSGQSMAAIIIYHASNDHSYREYLQVPLSSALQTGKTYYAEMWASLADNCQYGANNLGMFFSTNAPTSNRWDTLGYTPQIIEKKVITQKEGWVRIGGRFKAMAPYQALTIGNYYLDEHTTTTQVNGSRMQAAYFIDDVKVVPAVEVTGDSLICYGEAATLYAAGGQENISWVCTEKPGQAISYARTIQVLPKHTTTYLACSGNDTASFTVKMLQSPTSTLPEDTMLCEGDWLALSTEQADVSYTWPDGSHQTAYYINQNGTYEITLANRCDTLIEQIEAYFEPCNCKIYLPTAFSPNGDGINESFSATSNCPLTHYLLQVYDRWGKIIFQSETPDEFWKGNITPGTYFYTLSFSHKEAAQPKQQRGVITVLE